MRDTPEIRFKGFDDEWQEKKLDDLGIIISGFGFPKKEQGKKEGIPFYKISDMADPENNPIMVTASNYVGENQISRNSWDVIDLNPSIIFAKVGAAINLNRKRLALTPFLIDNNMMSFSSSSMDGNFMLTLFENIYLPKYSQVGAIPSYNDKIIGKVDVNIPDFNEQNQIGKLFARLNKLIKLKGKEIEKLEAYKNSMMEVMFPKTDEKEPRVRFKSFYKPWKTKKLSDISYVQSSNYKTTDVSNKGVPLYDVSRIIGYVDVTPILEDYITIVKDGSVGKISLRPKGSQYIGTMNAIFSDNCDIKFLYYLMQKIDFDKYTVGSVVPHIYYKNYSKEKLLVPSLEEQKLIGNFFYKLDKHIELKKDELEKLKEFKAALLDKMFV